MRNREPDEDESTGRDAGNHGTLLTQQEVAARLGCSRGRVHQIEKKALEKLRNRLGRDPLIRDFLATTKADD